MKFEPPEFSKLKDMASIDVGRLTENEARGILEGIRWPDGIECPYCQSKNVTRLKCKSENTRDGVIQCKACRKQFTVSIGTIMQGSHITLRQWVQAFNLMSGHKKGISALNLQRSLGLHSYRAAWYLSHRIRAAMSAGSFTLSGTVEVDETYVGGKPRKGDGKVHKRGRGTDKAPVLAMVERDGNAVSKPIENITAKTLKSAIKERVGGLSIIMTDELPSYNGIGDSFWGGHKTVNHGSGEYVNGDININTAESYFALLKRGVHGTFHHISKKHLGRYCDEFSFRWNHRKVTDGFRTENAIRGMSGKRLMYRDLIGAQG